MLARPATWPKAWAGTNATKFMCTDPHRARCSPTAPHSLLSPCDHPAQHRHRSLLKFFHPLLFLPCFHFLSEVKSLSTYLSLSSILIPSLPLWFFHLFYSPLSLSFLSPFILQSAITTLSCPWRTTHSHSPKVRIHHHPPSPPVIIIFLFIYF